MQPAAVISLSLFGALAVCCPLPPARGGSTQTKPYWSKPKSYWTSVNAQRQLTVSADQARYVVIIGGGKLWHKLTGLITDAEALKRSHLEPAAFGILIRNKRLIRALPTLLRFSGERLSGGQTGQADKIEVMFTTVDEAAFMWWKGKAYCYRPYIGSLAMRSGCGTRFDAFIGGTAWLARRHRQDVSLFRYNVYAKSPG